MTRRILRRVAVAMLLVPLVATVLFFLMHLAPGDPVFVLAGEDVRPEALDNLRRLYGLDRPLGEQYVRWLGNVLRWDWGQSIPTGRPTATILAEALPNSLLLGFVATVISFSVALLLALAAVYWRDGWIDHAIRIGSLIFYSTPAFWLALLAIWLFSYQLGWLPASGILSPGRSEVRGTADVLDMAWHLILPAGVLGLSGMAGTLRILRGELLEAMGRDYARTARAKGLSRARTLGVHALRNALVPAAQLLGHQLPALLNGVLIIEVVFAWPGLGRVAMDAILTRDYPVVLATTVLSSILVILGSLLADLLHMVLDPRVRDA